MHVDFLYRMSAFGDFSSIVPNPETMMSLVERFKTHNLMPTLINELDIITGQQIQRIALVSEDNNIKLVIGTERVDYELTVNDEDETNNEKLNDYLNNAQEAIKIILTDYQKNANRLAFHAGRFIIAKKPDELKKFISEYSNPITIYNNNTSPLEEWSTHLMIKKEFEICKTSESINVITDITKAILGRSDTGENSNGFQVLIDINTSAEKTILRFSPDSLGDFMQHAVEIRSEIIKDLE